ncbi:MAG: hypothetical protein JNG89_19400 [Planctomycetaceae bacterium]|nr:hypothetical protein [Planctomycetaceae bacterium]
MNNDTDAYSLLRRAIAALVATAQSDLRPAEKLELLCIQIGTAQHLLMQLPTENTAPSLRGPHFAGPAATGDRSRRTELS